MNFEKLTISSTDLIKVKLILLIGYYAEMFFVSSKSDPGFSAEGQEFIKFVCKNIIVSDRVTECLSQISILSMKLILSGESGDNILESVKMDIIKNLVMAIPDTETD